MEKEKLIESTIEEAGDEGMLRTAMAELMELLSNPDSDLAVIKTGAEHLQKLLGNYSDKEDVFYLSAKAEVESLIAQALERVDSRLNA